MPHSTEELKEALDIYLPSLSSRIPNDPNLLGAVENGMEALDNGDLSWARLNQIMHLCSQAGMSEGFYRYYFLSFPENHPYPVEKVFTDDDYEPPKGADEIKSLRQFHWGIRRFIYDAMLYWGNFRQAYRDLRQLSEVDIAELFAAKRINEARLNRRGQVVEPIAIPQDQRYLISEMACKTYEAKANIRDVDHVRLALEAFRELTKAGESVTPLALRQKTKELAETGNQLALFELLFEDSENEIETEDQVLDLYSAQFEISDKVRRQALQNTRTYLSICSDLDVYVATSMRTREDFREMARTCDRIFRDPALKGYNIRYFDPTLSAANYHEDKGIIECLMVKTCKVLIYFAQHKESLGKVSEYAMALSLGKPVIILCPPDARGTEIFQFYRDRHPLTRLIEFATGIVNGAVITQKLDHVVSLLERILSNKIEYDLNLKAGTTSYYLLRERLTKSTVRVMTEDRLLSETFWNNYHQVF
jgi:hypothetical protein